MNRAELYVKLQHIFNDLFFEPIELHDSLKATDVDEWDSVMQINIVLAIEEFFHIGFKMGEVEQASNVGEFVDLIWKKIQH